MYGKTFILSFSTNDTIIYGNDTKITTEIYSSNNKINLIIAFYIPSFLKLIILINILAKYNVTYLLSNNTIIILKKADINNLFLIIKTGKTMHNIYIIGYWGFWLYYI